MSFPNLAGNNGFKAGRDIDMHMLAELMGWPEWLVWCAASAGGILAVAVVVYMIEAALGLDRA